MLEFMGGIYWYDIENRLIGESVSCLETVIILKNMILIEMTRNTIFYKSQTNNIHCLK